MSDRGRIPLLVRAGLVRPTLRNSMPPRTPDTSLGAAGADETEADPAQTVATDPAVVDTQLHGSYGDVVRRHDSDLARDGEPLGGVATREERATRAETLHARQSRLSRWQAQR